MFRTYGIKVYLSAQFGAPALQIGGLSTDDPTNSGVKSWWTSLANTIYQKIPDFGGFLVKANSEGQPGPADYGKTHADGANMLAARWRPTTASSCGAPSSTQDDGTDRIGQAYKEFKPLDGKFSSNVVVQVKNGPARLPAARAVPPAVRGHARAHRWRWSCRSPRSIWARTRTSCSWGRSTKRS